MRFAALARVLVLLAFLAGPFGFLALDHAEFHCSGCPGDESGSDAAPCPICHAAGTPGLDEAGWNTVALYLAVDVAPAPRAERAASVLLAFSIHPRGPPALS
jgi:hypothetical protein